MHAVGAPEGGGGVEVKGRTIIDKGHIWVCALPGDNTKCGINRPVR